MKKYCMWLIVFTLVAGVWIVLAPAASEAGVIAEQTREDQASASQSHSKLYISNNKLKFVETSSKIATIFDLDGGWMTYIDMERKKYVKTRPEDFVRYLNSMKEAVRSQMEEKLKAMPPAQRAQMEEMLQAQGLMPPKKTSAVVKLTIKDTGITEKVSGYKSKKFEIYKNGRLEEEVWITRDSDFTSEFDTKKLARFVEKLKEATSDLGGSVDSEGEKRLVEQVYGQGFPMKTIEHGSFNTKVVERITNVQVSDIPSSEFEVPEGYTQITFDEMMTRLAR